MNTIFTVLQQDHSLIKYGVGVIERYYGNFTSEKEAIEYIQSLPDNGMNYKICECPINPKNYMDHMLHEGTLIIGGA